MQENAAKKARRTVIGRTLGGRATFKTLLDCLKLHLPAPLVSTTLLTKRLLWNSVRRWGGSQSHSAPDCCGMERFAPLILAMYPKLRRKLPGSRSSIYPRNQGSIPWLARVISQHQSSDHNGQQDRGGARNWANRVVHQKAHRTFDYNRIERHLQCRNPTLAKCGGEAQHLEKVRIWSPPGLPNV